MDCLTEPGDPTACVQTFPKISDDRPASNRGQAGVQDEADCREIPEVCVYRELLKDWSFSSFIKKVGMI